MRRVVGDGHEGRRLLIGAVALLALLIVDVVLVALAMGAHVAPRSSDGPAASTHPAEAASPSSPSPTPTQASPAVTTRLIAAIDGSRAWRATIGSCEEPGVFELTSDGGVTWEEAGPEMTGPVLALEPSADGRRGVAVVGDDQCIPVAHRTFTAAVGWEQHPVQQVGSYIAADGQLVLEGARVAAPCEEPSAVVGTGGGVVLCDTRALAMADGSWVKVGEDVVAIGPAVGGVALAMVLPEQCDGITIGVVAAGQMRTVCVAVPRDADVAVSVVGNVAWVWSSDTVQLITI